MICGYRLLERIGGGCFCNGVWRAQLQTAVDVTAPAVRPPPHVAVKIIDRDGGDTHLRHEIDLLRALDHPNVVRLHAVPSSPSRAFLVTELCDTDLQRHLAARPPLNYHEARRLMRQVSATTRTSHCASLWEVRVVALT